MGTRISLNFSVLTTIAVVAAALIICATGASSDAPRISIEPVSGGPGTPVTVVGSGFPSRTKLNARLGPPSVGATPQSYAEAVAGEWGEFTLAFEMPSCWPDGTPITAQELLIITLNEDGSVKATTSFDFAP